MAGMVKRADFLENEVVDLTEEIIGDVDIETKTVTNG